MRVFIPVKPSGEWYVYGCAPSAEAARNIAEAAAGCVPWKDCQAQVWRIIPANLTEIK